VSFRRLLRIDWDVIAGIIAAITAMILSFMGVISEYVVRGIILLLCALLLTRDLRGEAREHRMFDKLDLIKRYVFDISGAIKAPEIQLIGPKKMRHGYTAFASALYGEIRWVNFCCRMFRRQEVFEATLRPLIDNPNVTSVVLFCRPEERQHWQADVLPKLRKCDNGGKVREPCWRDLRGHVSMLIGDVDGDGRNEALVSILEEPFAASTQGTSVPRYLLRVFSGCDLMSYIEDAARYATNDFDAESESGVAQQADVPRATSP
jgi:hypothetical protein